MTGEHGSSFFSYHISHKVKFTIVCVCFLDIENVWQKLCLHLTRKINKEIQSIIYHSVEIYLYFNSIKKEENISASSTTRTSHFYLRSLDFSLFKLLCTTRVYTENHIIFRKYSSNTSSYYQLRVQTAFLSFSSLLKCQF